MPVEERKAPVGERTIEVRLRFWTDGIASKEGHFLPGFCLESGKAFVIANATHGVPAGNQVDFKNLDDLPRAVAKALESAGVKALVANRTG